jgi:hypothetical protein
MLKLPLDRYAYTSPVRDTLRTSRPLRVRSGARPRLGGRALVRGSLGVHASLARSSARHPCLASPSEETASVIYFGSTGMGLGLPASCGQPRLLLRCCRDDHDHSGAIHGPMKPRRHRTSRLRAERNQTPASCGGRTPGGVGSERPRVMLRWALKCAVCWPTAT